MNYKTGIGIDIHKLISGSSMKLGGVDIKSSKRIDAHSDGDIIYHSLSDAILGSLGEGDIGEHFPDNLSSTLNMDSAIILSHVFSLMQKEKFSINNADIVLMLENPKILDYKVEMRNNISTILHCDTKLINIKATTTEKLGFIGREEGIACYSIVSIIKQ